MIIHCCVSGIVCLLWKQNGWVSPPLQVAESDNLKEVEGMNDSFLREMRYWFRLPVLIPFQLVDTRIAENEGLRGSSYCERSIVPFYSS